jgi:glutathione S-transferase
MMEKSVEFDPVIELPWQERHEFAVLNPAMTVPVLTEENGTVIAGAYAITEYLEDINPDHSLLGTDPTSRAEVRRISDWFDIKFDKEVTQLLIGEKIMKRFLKRGTPEAAAIRCASHNIKHHLSYIEYLADRNNWLAGDYFSYADISAAAQISCVDYLGDVPWEKYERAKEWYARIKSRPSMRAVLKDSIPGLSPAKHYKNLDF